MNLKESQQKAVSKLFEESKKLLASNKMENVIVLKAPTGSGKTVMLTRYIEQLTNLKHEQLCFLWISIGKGNLHIQSQRKINELLNGKKSCSLLEDVIKQGQIKRNQIVVVNWEKLNSKKNGNWTNILMREGERRNFIEWLKMVKEKFKIILIIDESHHTMNTNTSREIINLIHPEIMVEASATPIYKSLSSNNVKFIEIKHEEVIRDGMIKKEVWINDNIDDVSGNHSLKIVLDMALLRRNELKEAYQKLNRQVNPLLLVQIPNAKDGEEVLKEILPYLAEKNITIDNGKLAIWTTRQKINLKGIEKNNSLVEVLIFKMAVATGWDCPRSQVLAKLRDTKSEVFDIQTIGRILRMPELIHYDNELLNRAYIYTNNPEFEIKAEYLSMFKVLKSSLKSDISNIEIDSEYLLNKERTLIRNSWLLEVYVEQVEKVFGLQKNSFNHNKNKLRNYGYYEDTNFLKNVFVKGKINASNIDKSNYKVTGEIFELDIGDYDIKNKLKEHLSSLFPQNYYPIYQLMRQFCVDYLGFSTFDLKLIDLIILLNIEQSFKTIFVSIELSYYDLYKKRVEKEISVEINKFSIPKMKLNDPETFEQVLAHKYSLNPCYLRKNRSQPEKEFTQLIDNLSHVDWWYKNEDSGKDNFSIIYEFDKKTHLFYPDYIVRFKTGLIGIFEVKGSSDPDAKTKTKAKAERLQEYLKDKEGMIGGIVRSEKGVLFINQSKSYDADDRSQWKPFVLAINK